MIQILLSGLLDAPFSSGEYLSLAGTDLCPAAPALEMRMASIYRVSPYTGARALRGSIAELPMPTRFTRRQLAMGGASALGASATAACPFRKFHPVGIRAVRQNRRIIRVDAFEGAKLSQ